MSILFPGSSLEKGSRFVATSKGVPGLLYGSEALSDCNKVSFFNQLTDVDVEYAGLASRVGDTPISTKLVAKATQLEAIAIAIGSYIDSSWSHEDVFKNVVSPIFTPGGIRTVVRETGNYQMYAGQLPSELTFAIKGIDNASLYWSRNFMASIRPMSMGVYLRNNEGAILGLMVGTVTSDDLLVVQPTKFAFLPIPVLSIRRAATALGGFESPDLTTFSILFPPNWENPYSLGSMLDTIPASLKTIQDTFGRIQWSSLCLVPKSIVDEYASDIE